MAINRRGFLALATMGALSLSQALVVSGTSAAGALAQERQEALWLPDYLHARESATVTLPHGGSGLVDVGEMILIVPNLNHVQRTRPDSLWLQRDDSLTISLTLHFA